MTRPPPFTLLDQDGKPWSLSEHRGTPVVLYFAERSPSRGPEDARARVGVRRLVRLAPDDAASARLQQPLRLSELSPDEFVSTLLPTMFASPVSPNDEEAFRFAMRDVHPAGFRAMARASSEDLRDVLQGIAVPTLLVYTDADERAPRPVAEHLHVAIAGSQLEVLPGVGHVCNIEAANQFNDVVRRFLADLAS